MTYEEYKIKWKSVPIRYNSSTSGTRHGNNLPFIYKYKNGQIHGAMYDDDSTTQTIEILKRFVFKDKWYGETLVYKK